MEASELKKCHDDFAYFCATYIKIKHPTKGLISFELHPFQKSIIEEYQNNRFILLKKFRQGGFSTLTAMYGLWDCLFHFGRRWLFVQKLDREAIHISRMIKDAVDYLPDYLRQTLTHTNDHTKTFAPTGSFMEFFGANSLCRKGKAITNLVVDEAAFIEGMEDNWKCIYPLLCNGGSAFILSTPNGTKNWFYKTWEAADQKKNSWKTVHVPYTEHPDNRNSEWIETIKKNIGEKSFQQEFEGRFNYEPKPMRIICEILEG